MAEAHESSDTNAEPAYEAPAIVWEERLDTRSNLAMACGKVQPIQGEPCALAPAS